MFAMLATLLDSLPRSVGHYPGPQHRQMYSADTATLPPSLGLFFVPISPGLGLDCLHFLTLLLALQLAASRVWPAEPMWRFRRLVPGCYLLQTRRGIRG